MKYKVVMSSISVSCVRGRMPLSFSGMNYKLGSLRGELMQVVSEDEP